MAGPDLSGLINPAVLAWARKASRLEPEEAAKKAGTTEERLLAWEAGTHAPTLAQLKRLADAYKRSSAVFFLDEIPKVPKRPVDFRRLELSSSHQMSPALANGLREADAKRAAALDILAQLEEAPPKFDVRVPKGATKESAALLLAERLGLPPRRRQGWGDEYTALTAWKAAVEATGVIVTQISGVEVSEMRGASLFFDELPVILLNSKDSPLGRVFSLLHEFTHLARAESALCDELEAAIRTSSSDSVEAFCNFVAGAILVPKVDLEAEPDVRSAHEQSRWNDEQLRRFRRRFWASKEVVLRRLLIIGKTSESNYQTARGDFEREYAAQATAPGGPVPIERRVVLANGRYLTRLAVDAFHMSAITGTELSRVLGTKLDHLPKIIDALARGTPA